MQSEKLFELSRVRLEQAQTVCPVRGTLTGVAYAFSAAFDPAFTMNMPCRILSAARYTYARDFLLKSGLTDTYDILFIYKGSVRVSCQGTQFRAGRGEALFLHMSKPFEIAQEDGAPLEFFHLRCSGYLCMSYYPLIAGEAERGILIKSPEIWEELLDKILYYMRYPTNSNNLLMMNVMTQLYTELYFCRYAFTEDRNAAYHHPQWFVDAIAMLEARYAENLQICDIAAALDISPSYFHKIFKAYSGLSPHQYLIRIRLNHARTLLMTTEHQIKYISGAVGFDSVSHFISHFKKLTGVTPAAYRNRLPKPNACG